MLLNEQTVLLSPSTSIVLYPYRKEHVPRYHAWMSSSEIRNLTASEPLTIEEEYEMQQSWQQDADKLTFIITNYDAEMVPNTDTAVQYMIGDVNLFLSQVDDADGSELAQSSEGTDQSVYAGELELMIAEVGARRKGFGRAALLIFMEYIVAHRHEIAGPGNILEHFSVKIGADNAASLALFESLGFAKHKYAEYFREWELRQSIEDFQSSKQDSISHKSKVAWSAHKLEHRST